MKKLILIILVLGLSGTVAFAAAADDAPPTLSAPGANTDDDDAPPSLTIEIPDDEVEDDTSDDDQVRATLAVQNATSGQTADTGPGILIYSVFPLVGYFYTRKKFKN